jgi:hypothetical protein
VIRALRTKGLWPERPRTEWTPAQRRRYGHAQRTAANAALDIEYWRDALIPALNVRKIAAVESGDDGTLARAARLCNILENGSAADFIRAFIRHRASDPNGVTALIATGRESDLETRRITWDVVSILALAAESEGSPDAA